MGRRGRVLSLAVLPLLAQVAENPIMGEVRPYFAGKFKRFTPLFIKKN